MYTATRLGIGGAAAYTQVNETADEQMEKHLEKLAKENPCNSLILKNYAQYLFEVTNNETYPHGDYKFVSLKPTRIIFGC